MDLLNDEIKSFRNIWKGGYFMGDPRDPVGWNCYEWMGYISVLHAIYQVCIKPYITKEKVVLEIGPGRGAWTKTMLEAKEIWCMDALSPEHNNFWGYIGEEYKNKVKYIQVHDFKCNNLPDNHFDYLFSFGTFCHITWKGQQEYYKNLFSKMHKGSNAMIMYADFDKYNEAVKNFKKLRVNPIFGNVIISSLKNIILYSRRYIRSRFYNINYSQLLDKNDNSNLSGRWYHAGISETSDYIKSVGWEVVNPDLGLSLRDPIIHFRKPE